VEDKNVVTAGQQSPTITNSKSVNTLAILVAFRSSSTPALALEIATAGIPKAQKDEAFTFTLEARGGTTPYTFAIDSGSLPAGLSLSAAGVISGTPTSQAASTFVVEVTDNNSDTDTQSYMLFVSRMPTTGTYGGNVNLTFNVTGFFHTEKRTINGRSQWFLVDPEGHPMPYFGVQSPLTGANLDFKYGSTAATYLARNARYSYWGFNALDSFSSTGGLPVGSYGSGSGSNVQLPWILFLPSGLDAAGDPTGESCGINEAIKNMKQASVKPSWLGAGSSGILEWYDPRWDTCTTNQVAYWDNVLTTGISSSGCTEGQDANCAAKWMIGIAIDDADVAAYFKGGGTGDIVTYPHSGYVVACARYQSTGGEIDPTVYSKYAWIDYLKTQYANVAAVNAAWGSDYVGWDDRTDTCTYITGNCVADEDGSSAWFGDAVSTPSVGSTLAGVDAELVVDLNAFLRLLAEEYAGTIIDNIQAIDGGEHLIFGPDAINNYGMDNRDDVWLGLKDAGVDVFYVNYDPGTGVDGGTPAEGSDARSMTNNERMYDVTGLPVTVWFSVVSQYDSYFWDDNPNYGHPNTFSQVQRGIAIRDTHLPILFGAQGTNNDYFVLGISWWQGWDNNSEKANWGLVTYATDNAYDGRETQSGTVPCQPPLDGSIAIQGQIIGPYNCGGDDEVARTSVSFNADGSASLGDGAETDFTLAFRYPYVKTSTLKIEEDGVERCADDGAGSFTGAGCTGSIDYETGTGTVSFTAAPGDGDVLTADYTSQGYGDSLSAIMTGIEDAWFTIFGDGNPPPPPHDAPTVKGGIIIRGGMKIQ
jgi:hypothetical protein